MNMSHTRTHYVNGSILALILRLVLVPQFDRTLKGPRAGIDNGTARGESVGVDGTGGRVGGDIFGFYDGDVGTVVFGGIWRWWHDRYLI